LKRRDACSALGNADVRRALALAKEGDPSEFRKEGVFAPVLRPTSVREDNTSDAFNRVTPDESHGPNNSGQERSLSEVRSWTSGRTERAALKEVDSQPARSAFPASARRDRC